MKILIILSALLLGGCATDPQTTQAIIAAQEAQAAQPTLSLVCPAGGCAMTYTDPRDRQGLRLPTNGWDALTSIGNNVTSLVPIIVTGRIATAGFDALRSSGGVQTTNTNTTGPVSTSTTGAVSTVGATTHTTTSANPSTTTTLSGTGVLGNGTYSTQANPVTSTVTTTNPVLVGAP